jgi:hypothetical protein
MVWSAPTSVENKERHDPTKPPLSCTVEGFCPCGCGGKALRWSRGPTLRVCLETKVGVSELIHRAPLQATQKHLLLVLLSHARNKSTCWPGEKRLQEAMGRRSRQTVSTHKKELRELGVVDWVKPGEEGNPHASALYRLNWGVLQGLAEEPWRVSARPLSSRSLTPRRRSKPTPERTDLQERVNPGKGDAPVEAEETTAVLQAAGGTAPVPASPELQEAPQEPRTEDFQGPRAAEATQEPRTEAAKATQEPWEAAAKEATAVVQEPWEVAAVVQEPWEDVAEELPEVVQEPQAPSEGLSASPEGSFASPELPAEDVETSDASAGPSAAPTTGASPPRSGASSLSFQVPMALLWTLWREAYLRVYRQTYLFTPADHAAARQLARSCAEVVLLHEARSGAPTHARLTFAQDYLRHVFHGFLQRPGRNDYLKERRHPLSALPGDLNALGLPWSSSRPAPEPRPAPPPPEVLPAAERRARIQELLQTLKTSPAPAPRPALSTRRGTG